ncbi:MAG: RNA methyltransferase [Verrucomicrobia bacterium]|nr:RNA methyltransferase [Verrucomicrobiota bacterium]
MAKPRSSKEYIYGINPSFEVIRGGRRRIMNAFVSESTKNNPRMKKLVELFERKEIPYEWVEKGRVIDLSGTKDNQGVVLKSSPYPYADFDKLLEGDRLLLLDNVEDPHNVGAILRSAEVFGFHSVLMSMRGTPEVYPSVVKVSAGATEFLQISKEMSGNNYARKAAEHGFKIVALDAKGTTDIRAIRGLGLEKTLLVIGGEDKSVGQFILNMADYVTSIEQSGSVNSLNASVAAAIAMFALSGPTK